MAQALQSRMARELRQLATDPPPGVSAWPRGDSVTQLDAEIQGPTDTVYEGGTFRVAVDAPARYPFEPPKVRFVTPVYHPNIDPEGRICLDILNMPPKGAWRPSLNLSTVLQSVTLLLAHPNPDDGLVTDITSEYKHRRQAFDVKARQWTRRHAVPCQAAHAGSTSPRTVDQGPPAAQETKQNLEQRAQGAPQCNKMEVDEENQQPVDRQHLGQKTAGGAVGAQKAQHQAQGSAEQQPAAKRSRLALRK